MKKKIWIPWVLAVLFLLGIPLTKPVGAHAKQLPCVEEVLLQRWDDEKGFVDVTEPPIFHFEDVEDKVTLRILFTLSGNYTQYDRINYSLDSEEEAFEFEAFYDAQNDWYASEFTFYGSIEPGTYFLGGVYGDSYDEAFSFGKDCGQDSFFITLSYTGPDEPDEPSEPDMWDGTPQVLDVYVKVNGKDLKKGQFIQNSDYLSVYFKTRSQLEVYNVWFELYYMEEGSQTESCMTFHLRERENYDAETDTYYVDIPLKNFVKGDYRFGNYGVVDDAGSGTMITPDNWSYLLSDCEFVLTDPRQTEFPESFVTEINQYIQVVSGGETILIPMMLDSGVPVNRLPLEWVWYATEKNITLELAMGDYEWLIHESDVATHSVSSVNMEVMLSYSYIPNKIRELCTDNTGLVFLSTMHEGNYGFRGELRVPLKEEWVGQYANLYVWYENINTLVPKESVLVGEGGVTTFSMNYGTDYVIEISDERAVPEYEPIPRPFPGEGTETPDTPDTEDPKTWPSFHEIHPDIQKNFVKFVVVDAVLLVVISVGFILYKKK